MANEARRLEVRGSTELLRQVLMRLGREASVEMNVQDLPDLEASRRHLPTGTRIYVSHLPKQSSGDTLKVCAAIKAAEFEPIPHVPVRLLESYEELHQLVDEAASVSVNELLLIAGDYAQAAGPFSSVEDVLKDLNLPAKGITRISIGGHPEGHTKVALDEIRRAEIEKVRIAQEAGLEATFVTQFFFESAPFIAWADSLREAGVTAEVRAGLAGPAKITTLLRFAMRCGVGPSIKALGSRPGAFCKAAGRARPRACARPIGRGDSPESEHLPRYAHVLFRGVHAHLPLAPRPGNGEIQIRWGG